MQQAFNRGRTGLIAGALSLLLSQSAFASIVNIHVPTPSIHITASNVRVNPPAIHFRGSFSAVHGVKSHRTDLTDGRNGHRNGKPTVSKEITVGSATVPGAGGREWHRWPIRSIPLSSIQQIIGDLEANTDFVGVSWNCTGGYQGPGNIVITQQNGPSGANTVKVSVLWEAAAPSTGTLTKNANGTYTLTFTPEGGDGYTYTATISWTPGANGGGSWTLTGVTQTTPAGVVQGFATSCTVGS